MTVALVTATEILVGSPAVPSGGNAHTTPGLADTTGVTAWCVVLNGASGSGKSSIAAALQQLWPRPLQATGIDTFLAAQSDRFFAIDGSLVEGFSWVPTNVEGQLAYDIIPGELGLGMVRAAHAFWRACVEAGLDQVIDDVWVVPQQPRWLAESLSLAKVVWVGVHCPLSILEQRERDRGNRPIGAARGHHDLVHSFRRYDVTVDTARATPEQCAVTILRCLRRRFTDAP